MPVIIIFLAYAFLGVFILYHMCKILKAILKAVFK